MGDEKTGGKTLPKKDDESGVKTASGSDPIINSFITAIGTLVTGQTNINNADKLITQTSSKGGPKPDNTGLLGILTKMSNNIDVIIGGNEKSIFENYWAAAKDNADYLKKNVLNNNFLSKKFIAEVKKIPSTLKNVNTLLNGIVDILKNKGGGEQTEAASVEVKGGSDIAAIFEAIKNFTYDEKTQTSLEQLAKDTSKGGRIEQLFTNINMLNEMDIDVEKFKNNLDKINEANNSTAKAIGSAESTSSTKNALKNLEGINKLILSVIGIGLLFVVVGLLAKWIDFEGIAMFAGILLVFVIAITGVFILASKLMKPGSGVIEGMESYMTVVSVAAVILIVGGLIMNFIDVSSLFAFATTLSIFLVMVLAPFIMFEQEASKYDIAETYKSITAMIIVASGIMILGSLVIGFINIGNLFKFTITLAIFLFAVLRTFVTVSNLYKGEGAEGMKDALIIIVGSAFIMFLGAAVMPLLNIKNLVLFTFTLGLFLLVTLRVLCIVSKWFKAEGQIAYRDALFLVVGAAFIMFLGAAIMPHVDYGMLMLFTGTLFLFLLAVMTPFLLLRPVIEHIKQAAIGVVFVVGISAAILFIGGALFLNYPGLIWAVPLFGAMLAAFVFGIMWTYRVNAAGVEKAIPTAGALSILVGISALALLGGGMLFINYPQLTWAVPVFGAYLFAFVMGMAGVIKILSDIKSTNLAQATLAMLGISGVLLIVSEAFMILALVSKQIDGIGGMVKFTLLVGGAMTVLGMLTVGIVALGLALGSPPMNVFATIAIGVVLAAASAFAIVALGFLGIAEALDRLSKIEEFDVTPLIKGVGSLVLLMYAMTPLITMAPFLLMVEAVMYNLTLIISKMAETVKDYADLKIGVYEGTKLVGYRHLDTSDFQSASDNISLIVTTLTEGIMKAYDANPGWYGSNVSPLWALAGPVGLIGAAIQGAHKSPLERVIAQSKLLAPLISQIADAVKDYADLKIKIYEGTKHVGYRHLATSDFKAASKNISLLVTALTEGIMLAYEAHKDWYGSGDVLSDFLSGGTPLERVINQSKMLGPLISKIGAAVADIANLKMAMHWDKDGKPTEYKSLDKADFNKAAKNTGKVVVTLTRAIMNVYENHKAWYKSGGFLGFGDSPLENVINTNKKLAELISDVAVSIKDYAELKMPTSYGADGKPDAYEVMENKHFKEAGTNIATVLNTLGNSIMQVYVDHSDWYKDGWIDDSPFVTVIETNTKLSKLISSVAAGVKDYAELRMPDYDAEWKDGKPTKYKEMQPGDFAAAGLNIGLVVTTTAMGLMGYVPKINGDKIDWEPGGAKKTIDDYILSDNNDKYEAFNRVLDASIKIGNVISSLANGISNFSKMMFPDYSGGIDENGNPKKGYKELNTDDFSKASQCITTVITTVAQALIDETNGPHSEWWKLDDDEFEKSPLFKILSASEKMGQGIANIASGLAEYANMKFATGYDKDGNATGYQRLSDGDLKKASEKITDVITLISGTMMGIYEAGKDSNSGKNIWDIETNWFGQPTGELSPIERVINASSTMASIIESMAKGIVLFAGGNMGTEDKPVTINDTTLQLAKASVTDVLTNVAKTIADLSTNPVTASLFVFEDYTETVLNGLMRMTEVIGGAAKGIQMFAALSVPTDWDENGKPTSFQKMSETEFGEASRNIKRVITAIGQSFNEVMLDAQNSWLKDIDDSSFTGINNFMSGLFGKQKTHSSSVVVIVMNAIMKMAMTLSIMSGCIYGYATMRFPKGVNADGHMEYSESLSYDDIDSAKNNIVKIISTLGQAMLTAVNSPVFLYMSSEEGSAQLEKLDEYVSSITDTIVSMSDSVKEMIEAESMKNLSTIVKNLGNSKTTIENLINKIGELVTLIFDKGSGIYLTFSFADLVNKYKDKYETTSNSFGNFINSIVKIIESLSNMDKPLNESYMKINSLYNLFENERYADKIRSIISNIGFMLQDMRKITQFDNLFVDKETGMAGFAKGVADFFVGTNESRAEANREKAQEEINSIVEKLAIYSNLILTVTDTLKKINNNVSDVKMINYVEFNNSIIGFSNAITTVKQAMADTTKEEAENISIIIKSYSSALDSLIVTSSRSNGLKNFGGQVNQLEKFVKTVNSIKLLNLNQMNKFVTSLNQLANKMGNLDRLTEAIANKLSKVLEKLVERLAHAEQTIVKADEIQKRRHELIKKSVEEVSNLMKQPMTIEVQAMSSGTSEATTGADTNNQSGNNTNSTT